MNATFVDQVGGAHYGAEYQHWDLVAETGLDYFRANATKYVTRAYKKNGMQDLKKAQSYLKKLAALLTTVSTSHALSNHFYGITMQGVTVLMGDTVSPVQTTNEKFFPANPDLSTLQKSLFLEILRCRTSKDLMDVYDAIEVWLTSSLLLEEKDHLVMSDMLAIRDRAAEPTSAYVDQDQG